MLKFFRKIFELIFGHKNPNEESNVNESTFPNTFEQEKIYFSTIAVTDKTPNADSIGKNDFIHVEYEGKSYWVMFRCPCGCNTLITLSLQKTHNPNWKLIQTENGRATLYPSIWQNRGCCSHFWINDGKVDMCFNTGIEPWNAEPEKYSKLK